MSLCVSNIMDQFNTTLTQRGYKTIGSNGLEQQQKSDNTFTDMLDRLQASVTQDGEQQACGSCPLLGYAENGLPVVGSSAEAYVTSIKTLAEKAVARGQDEDSLTFILGSVPVFDGATGPLLGYQMRAAVALTGVSPQRDVS